MEGPGKIGAMGRLEELSGNSTAEVGEQLPGAVDGQLLQALYPFQWCRVIDKPSPRPFPPPLVLVEYIVGTQ